MTDQHMLPMTPGEWATALETAALTAGPAFSFRAVTGEYDAAVHVATSGQLTDESRQELINELLKAVNETVDRVLCYRTVRTTYRPSQPQESR